MYVPTSYFKIYHKEIRDSWPGSFSKNRNCGDASGDASHFTVGIALENSESTRVLKNCQASRYIITGKIGKARLAKKIQKD
jgi:hypothetical protein